MQTLPCYSILGLVAAIAFITSLASVSFMPVPDSLCIIFARPVVTLILSAIVLGDKLNTLKCFSATLLLVGVTLVCQPPFLFHTTPDTEDTSDSDHGALYFVGVALAGTACFTNGLLDILIAKCQVMFRQLPIMNIIITNVSGSVNCCLG